jgi:hypothetical protein
MGHCISVFVIKKNESKIDLSKYEHAEAPQGFVVIPDDKLWSLCDDPGSKRALELISEKISTGAVAYLTTDYFGGAGEQSGEFYDPTSRPGKVYEMHSDNINKVLAEMGVIKEGGLDEFDTIHLGRYRSNSDFFEKEEEEDDHEAFFGPARKKNSFDRNEIENFPTWCNEHYHHKGKDEWTHGSGGNEKHYSSDDLLTIYISQSENYMKENSSDSTGTKKYRML